MAANSASNWAMDNNDPSQTCQPVMVRLKANSRISPIKGSLMVMLQKVVAARGDGRNQLRDGNMPLNAMAKLTAW